MMRSQDSTVTSGPSPVTFDTVPLVETRADLTRIARAMEREAADRYAALMAEAERRGLPSLAAVFRRLEAAEREHLDWVKTLEGTVGPTEGEDGAFTWSPGVSEVGDVVSPATRDLEFLTPWDVLDLALTNEERAFAFYARVAAKTEDGEARVLAETLAAEELEHVAWLRLHRLKAWPEERETREGLRPEAGFPSPRASLDDLRTLARRVTEEMAARLDAVEKSLDGMGRKPGGRGGGTGEKGEERSTVREEVRRADLLYRSWLSVCEKTKDETVLRFAQEEADKALGLLARLRDVLAKARG